MGVQNGHRCYATGRSGWLISWDGRPQANATHRSAIRVLPEPRQRRDFAFARGRLVGLIKTFFQLQFQFQHGDLNVLAIDFFPGVEVVGLTGRKFQHPVR